MHSTRRRGIALWGSTVLGCLALVHCGGSGSGGSLFTGEDSGPERDSTTGMDDGSPVPPDGPETTPPADGNTGDEGTLDAGHDATLEDAGHDAAPVDGGLDATADTGVDAGYDAGDAALDGSGHDAALDGSVDATVDGGDASSQDAGPAPIPCDAQAACNTDASTVMCCSGYCVDTARDPANCGQCGTACTTSQFCTGTACDDAIIANVCGNPRATVAFDPYGVDNEAGAAMGTALAAYCVPATSVVQVPQTTAGVLDPSGSGRPITGVGNTFITGGGAFGQSGVDYIELQANLSPIYLQNNGTNSRILTRAGAEIVNVLDTSLTEHHDYFYVQLTVEPQSGTLCLSGVGVLGPGSQAAGYYAATELIPHHTSYTASWYVYEWTDTNGDSIANGGDTFTLVQAGP